MLTDTQIRGAKPRPAAYRMTDSAGLFLHVMPGGSRVWRLRYEVDGKEKLLTLGRYPDMALREARAAREEAKGTLRDGRDPGTEQKARRLAGAQARARTFQEIAREWHAARVSTWTATHAGDVLSSLELYVFPKIGNMPLRDITPPVILAVVRAIEKRPAIETARRVRQRISAAFVWAIACGLAETDPAAVVKGALAPLVKGRQPAIVDLEGVRDVLRRAEAEPSHPGTRLALRLLALTAVRPGEIRGAAPAEFEGMDGPEPIWRIPAERMKMKRAHAVPLSRQAVDVVRAATRLIGRGPLLFPNVRNAHKPMSENAIGYLLNRAGFHGRHVPHGWRAAFSSIMNENRPEDRAVIDLMLAHAPKDGVEGAYNRAEHMARRREIGQAWADMLLDGMGAAEEVLLGARR